MKYRPKAWQLQAEVHTHTHTHWRKCGCSNGADTRPNMGGGRWAPPIKMRGVSDLERCPFPICVTASNLVTLSQTVWVLIGGPKNFRVRWARPLEWGVLDSLKTRPSPTTAITAKFGHSRSNGWCVITEISKKVWPFLFHLSGPLKVIGINTDQSAVHEFLLVFHSNYGHISYRFRDKGRYLKKIPPRVFNAPTLEFPLKLCNGSGARKTRMVPLPGCQKSDIVSIRLHTISVHWTDGRMDVP